MSKLRNLYDPLCGDLARHFLGAPGRPLEQSQVDSLARDIQEAVETWFSCEHAVHLAARRSGNPACQHQQINTEGNCDKCGVQCVVSVAEDPTHPLVETPEEAAQ